MFPFRVYFHPWARPPRPGLLACITFSQLIDIIILKNMKLYIARKKYRKSFRKGGKNMKLRDEHKKAGEVASMPNALWLCGCDSTALLFYLFVFCLSFCCRCCCYFCWPCNEGEPSKLGAKHFSLECFTAQIWQDVRLSTASVSHLYLKSPLHHLPFRRHKYTYSSSPSSLYPWIDHRFFAKT